MLQKIRTIYKEKRHHVRRVVPLTLLASVALVGSVFLAQKEFVPKAGQKTMPRIEEVKAVYSVGNKIRISGSGFVNNNSYRVKDSHFVEPLVSTNDGKELVFRLWLAVRNVQQSPWQNCGAGKTCSVPLQIVNGDGMASNVSQFSLTMPDRPLTVTYGPATDTPKVQDAMPGTEVDVLHTTIHTSSDNYDEVQVHDAGIVLVSDKPLDCSKTFGPVTLSDTEGHNYYTYPLSLYTTPYSWSFIPTGACITTFTLPGVFSAQDDPNEIVISPGSEKTFVAHVVIKEGAPKISFKARLGFMFEPSYTQYDQFGELESKFGNPVTIK